MLSSKALFGNAFEQLTCPQEDVFLPHEPLIPHWGLGHNSLSLRKLSPAERASQTARRKVIYETLHPETQHGNPGVSRQVGDTQERTEQSRFTTETASATGKSERVVQRDAERGTKVIGEVIEFDHRHAAGHRRLSRQAQGNMNGPT
ncbi:hypothetical protein [Pararhizobium sp.]|uniref:hypothetical protein n=1 Tax=Pararhizobium sp. TaxID=1977563 RepID=UPI00271BC2D2|nr:hypothetical protein [Pararhizobium sp.]MDO9416215.1 hypothetical protein [Pararhizobium sp.]